jgi:hypothetical protein
MDATKVEIPAQEEDKKLEHSPMKAFAHPLRHHRLAPHRSSSTSLISLEGGISGMTFPSSSDILFGDKMDEDDVLESDSEVIEGLPAVGEPPVFPLLLEEEEVPLPEVLRAPVPHSPIRVPSSSFWPLETAVALELVGVDVVIPPPVDWEGAVELDEFSLDDVHNVLQIHPGRNESSEINDDAIYLSGENVWDLGVGENDHLGVIPSVDGTLQLDRDLVRQDENEYLRNDDNDDDDGENDRSKYVEGISDHVPIAPPPHPAPEELVELEFMFGAASREVGSASNTRDVQTTGDATPSSRQVAGTFGPHQLDYRLNNPSLIASWAQASLLKTMFRFQFGLAVVIVGFRVKVREAVRAALLREPD